MKTSWIYIEHKRRASTWMRAVCGLDLSLSPTNDFGGRLGLEIGVERPNIRQ